MAGVVKLVNQLAAGLQFVGKGRPFWRRVNVGRDGGPQLEGFIWHVGCHRRARDVGVTEVAHVLQWHRGRVRQVFNVHVKIKQPTVSHHGDRWGS